MPAEPVRQGEPVQRGHLRVVGAGGAGQGEGAPAAPVAPPDPAVDLAEEALMLGAVLGAVSARCVWPR